MQDEPLGRSAEVFPPGAMRCPECNGEGALIVSSTGPESALPCPRCAGKGWIEAPLFVLGYRTVRVLDREWTEEITSTTALGQFLRGLRWLSTQLAHAGRK